MTLHDLDFKNSSVLTATKPGKVIQIVKCFFSLSMNQKLFFSHYKFEKFSLSKVSS
jgi:hypothetical protein